MRAALNFVLGVECFGLAFLAAAWLVALSARFKWRFTRWFWPVLLGWFPPIVAGVYLHEDGVQPALATYRWFPTAAALGVTLIGGFVLVTIALSAVGLWRRGQRKAARARSWPLGKLTLVWHLCGAAIILTAFAQDIRIRRRISVLRQQSASQIESLRPRPLPKSRNAAFLYRQAYMALPGKSDAPEWLHEGKHPDFDPSRPDVIAYIDRHRPSIDLALRAAAISKCQFPIHRTEHALSSDEEQVRRFIALALTLGVDARRSAAAGNLPACLVRLQGLERMERHALQQHVLNWYWCGYAINSFRAWAVESIFGQADFSADQFGPAAKGSVHPSWSALHPLSTLVKADFQEWACAVYAGEKHDEAMLHSFDPPQPPQPLRRDRTWLYMPLRVLYFNDDLHWMDMRIETMREIMQLPENQARGDLEPLDAMRQPLIRGARIGTSLAWADFAPELTLAQAATMEAQSGLADLVVAVASFRAHRGEYPRHLNQLIPDFILRIPVDPFDGKPLKMKAEAGGIVLYSCGEDCEDNGGEDVLTRTQRRADLAFCLGAPFAKRRIQLKEFGNPWYRTGR